MSVACIATVEVDDEMIAIAEELDRLHERAEKLGARGRRLKRISPAYSRELQETNDALNDAHDRFVKMMEDRDLNGFVYRGRLYVDMNTDNGSVWEFSGPALVFDIDGITFVWARDPRGMCRRCPVELCRPLVCNGTVICNIQVAADIPREDAPTFDLGAWLAKEGGSREGA